MKVVLVGGHLAPALSVLETLPKDTKVLFVGRKYALEGDMSLSLEYRTMSQLRTPFIGLNTGRLQRRLTKFTLFSLLKIPFGIIKSFFILAEFRPDVVLSFGGYVSIPVIFSAFLLRIPIVIHEQTLEAGLANNFLSRFATKICISWDSSKKYFPKEKIVLTGNPIRRFPIINMPEGKKFLIFDNKSPIIYITGGSSGSHFINVLIEKIIVKLLEKYNVIHQTGDAHEHHDFDTLVKIKGSLPKQIGDNYIVEKFIDPSKIGELIKMSSLIVSRSGMNTITELIYFQKPAILIPLPFSQKNEQLKNAKFFEKIGLGRILQQEKLSSEKLLKTINSMINKIDSYKINQHDYKSLSGKNAAQNIVGVISYVYKSKTKKVI